MPNARILIETSTFESSAFLEEDTEPETLADPNQELIDAVMDPAISVKECVDVDVSVKMAITCCSKSKYKITWINRLQEI